MNRPALAALLLLTGCQAAQPGGTADLPPPVRLDTLVAADTRVAEVGYRLAVANAELCTRTAPLAGWSLHAANLYSPDMRPAAVARFGVSGDLPGVLHVASDSPAERAGVKVGDLILSVGGRMLNAGPDREDAVYEGFAANVAVIDQALSRGATALRVRRGETELDLTVTPSPGCAYGFQVDPSPEFYASADADRVFISSSLTVYAADNEELAVVLGHELAHAALNHPAERRGLGKLPWRTETREIEADRVGLYFMARAGFDPSRGPVFWRRFGADYARARYAQWGHQSAEERAHALEAVATEIGALQAGGSPITP